MLRTPRAGSRPGLRFTCQFVVALSLVATLAPSRTARGEDLAAGKRTFGRCAGCHVAPDPTIRIDRAWIASVNSSA